MNNKLMKVVLLVCNIFMTVLVWLPWGVLFGTTRVSSEGEKTILYEYYAYYDMLPFSFGEFIPFTLVIFSVVSLIVYIIFRKYNFIISFLAILYPLMFVLQLIHIILFKDTIINYIMLGLTFINSIIILYLRIKAAKDDIY